ncbi:MAG: DUF1573 domain-containing protein [Nitrospinae bacterium]|nr:DUF1573 domain-containing protein [Nitrospinota bacterium]
MRVTLLSLLAVLILTFPASAATITVTANAADALNGADGSCALREAIKNMNDGADTFADCAKTGAAYGTSDTINIPAGTYTNAIAGGIGEDANATGDLDILANVTITGAGAGSSIIDGGALDRVIHIGAGRTVSFSGVTIQNGLNAGDGGGIYNGVATLTVTNSTISGNTTTSNGGGIYNSLGGTATVTNSTISGNATTFGGAGGGGGIYNGGRITVTNTTITGNTSNGWGGGIYDDEIGTITNCTISGNTAATNIGGGILANFNVTVINSTITNNSGAGIYRNSGIVTISNSIIVNQAADWDCSNGGFTSNGHNLDSDGTCGLGGAGDISNSALANLAALANNGGSTQTHALQVGSAAIDAGDCNGGSVTTDQRGYTRPSGSACDIGSYEYGAVAPVVEAGSSSSSASSTSGCTDYHATNYSPSATSNDGSCIFPDPDLGDIGSQTVSFGPVAISRSSTQTIVIENGGGISTFIHRVDISGTGFTIVSDTCTNQPVIPGRSCEIVIAFNPGTEGDVTGTVEVWTNNSRYYPLTIALSGASSGQPPTEPALMAPGDGETITGTSVTLQWTPGQAPDGGSVTNKVFVCESADFTGCSEPTATARSSGAVVPAAFVVVMGLLAPLGMRTRRGRTLAIAFLLIAGSAFASCGGGSSKSTTSDNSIKQTVTGLKPSTVYYWKVTSETATGAATDSPVRNFTTGM